MTCTVGWMQMIGEVALKAVDVFETYLLDLRMLDGISFCSWVQIVKPDTP